MIFLDTDFLFALFSGDDKHHLRVREVKADEREAFDYFAKHRDKVYGFVDCVSFVVMDRHGITEALSVDSDFTHRFTAIPGPIQ